MQTELKSFRSNHLEGKGCYRSLDGQITARIHDDGKDLELMENLGGLCEDTRVGDTRLRRGQGIDEGSTQERSWLTVIGVSKTSCGSAQDSVASVLILLVPH
jgi:hypothetical protein